MSVSNSFRKDGPALVSILHTPISSIQNNLLTYSFSSSLSYKLPFLSSTLRFKKSIVEIEENDNVDSDIKIQPLSSQWPLQPILQIL